MRKRFFLLIIILELAINLSACNTDENKSEISPTLSENNNRMKVKISIGSKSYTATLLDNTTTKELKAMLPITLNMNEHNKNEKYGNLPVGLKTDTSTKQTIHCGDLMLFGSSTLVLFYKTFSSSYSYTKIGTIDDPSGLEAALGIGNVAVTFEQ